MAPRQEQQKSGCSFATRMPEMRPSMDAQNDIDWTVPAQSYPNIDEAPSFISP